jgi:hypothetical protein
MIPPAAVESLLSEIAWPRNEAYGILPYDTEHPIREFSIFMRKMLHFSRP